MTTGERLKQRRLELGMTQDELASLVGYSHRSSINKIELDLAHISQKKIQALAKALGVTPDYFFYGSEKRDPVIVLEALNEDNQSRLLSYYNYLLEQQNKEKKDE